MIRFGQIPDVDIVLIDRTDMQPLGGGEAIDCSDHRGDCQCHFRRRRCAPAPGSVHPAARADAMKTT